MSTWFYLRVISRGSGAFFSSDKPGPMLKGKELTLARCLQALDKWEGLAEDPFRGLRAGPADFSPLSFLASKKPFYLENRRKSR